MSAEPQSALVFAATAPSNRNQPPGENKTEVAAHRHVSFFIQGLNEVRLVHAVVFESIHDYL